MIGFYRGNDIIITGGVLIPEVLVPTCIRETTTSFLDLFGEGFGGIHGPVPEGRPTPHPPLAGPYQLTPSHLILMTRHHPRDKLRRRSYG